MKKNRSSILIRHVLASSLFAISCVHADTILNAATSTPLVTSVNGPNITVTQTGRITVATTPITIDSTYSTVLLEQGNKYCIPGTLLPAGGSAVDIIGTPFSSGANSSVTIRPVSSMLGFDADVVRIGANNVNIVNAGYLEYSMFNKAGSVIHVLPNGNSNNAHVFNDLTGVMDNHNSVDDAVVLLEAKASGFQLNNFGLIQSNSDVLAAAVQLDGQFDFLKNSGFIQQTQTSTVDAVFPPTVVWINSEIGSGDVINNPTGVITALDRANILNTVHVLTDANMNDIVNKGIIENLSLSRNDYNVGGSAIDIDGTLDRLYNEGRIYSTEAHTDVQDPAKLIYTPTILGDFNAVVTNGFINNGKVIHGLIRGDAVNFVNMAEMSLYNKGIILGSVELSGNGIFSGSEPVFTMIDGAIMGPVIGESFGNDRFVVQGGTLLSLETNSNNFTQTANVYNLSGGSISNYLRLPDVFNGSHYINLSGTAVGNILGGVGREIINVTGGSFVLLDGNVFNNQPADTLNILASFENNGLIRNINNIHIQNLGTVFTQNQWITGLTTFTIDRGTIFVPNSMIQMDTFFESQDSSFINATINNSGIVLVTSPHATFDFSTDLGTILGSFNNLFGGEVILGTQGILRILGNNIGDTEDNLFPPPATILIPGNPLYVNYPGSNLNVQIFGPYCKAPLYGKMIVDSFGREHFAVALENGSVIQPQFKGFLPRNSLFDVITVNNGGYWQSLTPDIDNQATLIPYPSALVYFTMQTIEQGTGTIINPPPGPENTAILRLTSHRNTFESLSSTRVTKGVAPVLDRFADGKCPPTYTFYQLLSEFDQIPTQEGVELAMESLLPPFNYGLIAGSHIGMDSTFEAITDRIFEVAWNKATREKGQAFGDHSNPIGFWARSLGAYLDQGYREGVAGYNAKGVGLSLGADWGFNDCSTYGLALSYTRVNIDDKNWAPKDEAINSYQATIYGAFDWCYGIFLDGMVGYARNNYNVNHVIHVHDILTGAQSSFKGNQWGAQGDLGIAIPNCKSYFLAPFVRLKYISVGLDNYVENQREDFNLKVNNEDAIEFLGGIGLRAAMDYNLWGVDWVPEGMLMLGYDFKNNGENTVAQFLGAGPAFTTNGVTPAKTLVDIGLALNGVCGASVITAKYNVELRNKFVGNSAYLQYYYAWF